MHRYQFGDKPAITDLNEAVNKLVIYFRDEPSFALAATTEGFVKLKEVSGGDANISIRSVIGWAFGTIIDGVPLQKIIEAQAKLSIIPTEAKDAGRQALGIVIDYLAASRSGNWFGGVGVNGISLIKGSNNANFVDHLLKKAGITTDNLTMLENNGTFFLRQLQTEYDKWMQKTSVNLTASHPLPKLWPLDHMQTQIFMPAPLTVAASQATTKPFPTNEQFCNDPVHGAGLASCRYAGPMD